VFKEKQETCGMHSFMSSSSKAWTFNHFTPMRCLLELVSGVVIHGLQG
jgi:hypothetical protein